MRLIISFRTPDMNTRDAEGGNQTHVKELYAIISLQLLITPAVFSALVTRERSSFYAPIRQCSEFSCQRAQIAHRYRVQLGFIVEFLILSVRLSHRMRCQVLGMLCEGFER